MQHPGQVSLVREEEGVGRRDGVFTVQTLGIRTLGVRGVQAHWGSFSFGFRFKLISVVILLCLLARPAAFNVISLLWKYLLLGQKAGLMHKAESKEDVPGVFSV